MMVASSLISEIPLLFGCDCKRDGMNEVGCPRSGAKPSRVSLDQSLFAIRDHLYSQLPTFSGGELVGMVEGGRPRLADAGCYVQRTSFASQLYVDGRGDTPGDPRFTRRAIVQILNFEFPNTIYRYLFGPGALVEMFVPFWKSTGRC